MSERPTSHSHRLGHAVRLLRDAQGWSQRELSLRAGVSRQTLQSLERGDARKRLAGTLERVATALGTTVDDLRAAARAPAEAA